MILGRDLAVLSELFFNLTKQSCEWLNVAETETAYAVMTRAQAGLQLLPDFDSSLLQGGTKGSKKSQGQRRLLKCLGSPVPKTSTKGLEARDWQIPAN